MLNCGNVLEDRYKFIHYVPLVSFYPRKIVKYHSAGNIIENMKLQPGGRTFDYFELIYLTKR